MNVAGEYTGKGFAISDVIDLLHIPGYTLYVTGRRTRNYH